MQTRLVPLEAGRAGRPIPLVGDDLVIGRDPASDVLVDHACVSRRHALLRRYGEHHTLEDLGSSNGTAINGTPIREAVLLRPGDRVELGGEAILLYEATGADEQARRDPALPLALGAGLLLVVGLLLGVFFWLGDGEDPRYAEAVRLAREGVAASQAGDQATAKTRLQSAAGILFKSGLLDDVPRQDVMHVAMRQLGERLEEPVDLRAVFERALAWQPPRPETAPDEGLGCRLDRVPPDALDACLRERIELVLIGLRQDPSNVPEDFHREVGRRLRIEREFIERSLERGRPVIPMLRRELEAAKIPPLLHYLALIESGYKNTATSTARAAGMWQFMPGTARQYGLHVTNGLDERRDQKKSTRAAARYLRDLAFEFGGDALLLALAGYNRGENGVRRALKKLDDPFSDRSYWRLVEKDLLPRETAEYVTRFMAAAVAGEAGVPRSETLRAAGY